MTATKALVAAARRVRTRPPRRLPCLCRSLPARVWRPVLAPARETARAPYAPVFGSCREGRAGCRCQRGLAQRAAASGDRTAPELAGLSEVNVISRRGAPMAFALWADLVQRQVRHQTRRHHRGATALPRAQILST